jgi:TetR/AcrR family transcriptional repressor of nem operon
MVRPREFDETEVLDQALCVFWRLGYEGTSIADLVSATGLQRQSLYNVFTDKHGLFRASIGRYITHMEESLVPLQRAETTVADLRVYMEGVLEHQRKGSFGACLLVKTAFGPESADPEVRKAVELGANAVRSRFERVIASEIERGAVASSTSPKASAAFLYTVLNGLSALIRTGGAHAQIANVLSQAFAGLAAPNAGRRALARKKHAR